MAPVELARAAELYTKSKQKNKNLMKLVGGLSLILILLVFAIVGMTARVIEMSKETQTDDNGITTVAGSDQPASTAQVNQQGELTESFLLQPTQLDAVKSLYFPEDTAVTCPANTYCQGGTELSYTVTGWARNTEAGLTFYTARGDTINIKASGALTIKDSAGATLYTDTDSSGRRRLRQRGGESPATAAFLHCTTSLVSESDRSDAGMLVVRAGFLFATAGAFQLSSGYGGAARGQRGGG